MPGSRRDVFNSKIIQDNKTAVRANYNSKFNEAIKKLSAIIRPNRISEILSIGFKSRLSLKGSLTICSGFFNVFPSDD